MRLAEATIFNYKSIANETKLVVDDRVTTLLGKSEAGKTSILEAIWCVSVEGPYNDRSCSWLPRPDPDVIVTTLRFDLEPSDAQRLKQAGISLAEGASFEVGSRWDGNLVILGAPGAQTKLQIPDELIRDLRRLRARCRALAREVAQSALPAGLAEEVSAALNDLAAQLQPKSTPEEQDASLTQGMAWASELQAQIVGARREGLLQEGTFIQRRFSLITNDIGRARRLNQWIEVEAGSVDSAQLRALLPRVLLVSGDETDFLQDSVPLGQLVKEPEKFPLIVNLLSLGGLSVATLQLPDKTERNRQLDRAQDILSRTLSSLWRQEEVRIELDVEEDELRIELKGPEGHYGRPAHRSPGFRWFVSFYLKLLSLGTLGGAVGPAEDTPQTMLLLDEPGLRLHASAQQDLLELFEQVGERAQLIYTTHSPFMINRNFPTPYPSSDQAGKPKGHVRQ